MIVEGTRKREMRQGSLWYKKVIIIILIITPGDLYYLG